VEIGDVIGTALSRLAQGLNQHQLVVDVEPNLPMLWIDFVLIEHVLINLLENAAKYSPAQTTIRVSAQHEGHSIVVEVADEGMGVPPAERERIFDKFYRVQRGDRHGAGVGLGLSICRGIIDAHGGKISASSPPEGKGTVFSVILPAEKAPPAMAER
jgi:two-component system sensor histidine kinase KdpD